MTRYLSLPLFSQDTRNLLSDAEEEKAAEKEAFAKRVTAANADEAANEQEKVDPIMQEVQNAFADPSLNDDGYKARLQELLPTEWESVWALTAAKRRHDHLQQPAK